MTEQLRLHLQEGGGSWHAKSAKKALSLLEGSASLGLSAGEAEERRKLFGENALPAEQAPSRLTVFFRQFKNPFILILLAAGLVTLLLQDFVDTIVIAGAVLVNAAVGYAQEYRATQALAALKKAVKVRATVLRDGKEHEVAQEDVVPGDLVFLRSGGKVPADGRIVEANGLKINEAPLTGEWVPSDKSSDALAPDTPLADRENMAYMGSVVEEGEGIMLVTATGLHAEIGKVAELVRTLQEERTPYQVRLQRFSKIVAGTVLLLALGIFGLGVAAGREFVEIFTTAVAIAVSAVPEGLPIAVTVVLAIGMQRILRRKGLVRRLTAAETLGSAGVIATDKTLTLTEGRMEVDRVFAPDEERALLVAGVANEAYAERGPGSSTQLRGRPTDKALLAAAMQRGIEPARYREEREVVERVPFNSKTKYNAIAFRRGSSIDLLFAGAPETMLGASRMPSQDLRAFEEKLRELTGRGLRVVATAERSIAESAYEKEKRTGLLAGCRVTGLIALKDPVRKTAPGAIEEARKAGIRTVMVTGDHLLTAQAVAREVGIPANPENVIEGRELEQLSSRELAERIPKLTVYARVEPAHKLRIIEAWQATGESIAMTGDGVNDAPALKKADIGIALGSGTDVAKETADLVLLGDDFRIIPSAIREGRVMVANIRKIATYLLSGSFTETVLVTAALFLGWPLPIVAAQILWINLVQGSLPAMALTFEKGSRNIMGRAPERKDAPFLTGEMKALIFGVGISTDFLLLGLFAWLFLATSLSLEHVRTIMFVGLAIDSLLYIFSLKNLKENIWEYNPFSNLWLVGAVLVGFLLLAAAVYAPPLQLLFETVPLGLFDWMLLFGLGLINLILIEAVKRAFK